MGKAKRNNKEKDKLRSIIRQDTVQTMMIYLVANSLTEKDIDSLLVLQEARLVKSKIPRDTVVQELNILAKSITVLRKSLGEQCIQLKN